jgi:hypothetical protein
MRGGQLIPFLILDPATTAQGSADLNLIHEVNEINEIQIKEIGKPTKMRTSILSPKGKTPKGLRKGASVEFQLQSTEMKGSDSLVRAVGVREIGAKGRRENSRNEYINMNSEVHT